LANTLMLNLKQHSILNTAGLFEPKFGSNIDKPKCWVKNVI